MDCLVHLGADVIGKVVLDRHTGSGSDAHEGPTLWGQLVPTPAYLPIRATCQELRQVIHPDVYPGQPAPRMPAGMIASESVDSFRRRMMAIDASRALGLRLTRLDGAEVPMMFVLIEDFTPTAEERAGLPPGDTRATMEFLLVAAVMHPGSKPPAGLA